jgi:hypothetical protein
LSEILKNKLAGDLYGFCLCRGRSGTDVVDSGQLEKLSDQIGTSDEGYGGHDDIEELARISRSGQPNVERFFSGSSERDFLPCLW